MRAGEIYNVPSYINARSNQKRMDLQKELMQFFKIVKMYVGGRQYDAKMDVQFKASSDSLASHFMNRVYADAAVGQFNGLPLVTQDEISAATALGRLYVTTYSHLDDPSIN
jgi:hypothetical protein